MLWDQNPLAIQKQQSIQATKRVVGAYTVVPLVVSEFYGYAELDIIILQPEPIGAVVSNAGDLDNRLKTVLDALRCPLSLDELPTAAQPGPNETPFFCLLEDDHLIRSLRVSADQLLDPSTSKTDVVMVIQVHVFQSVRTLGGIGSY